MTVQIAPYFTKCISLALFSTFTIQSIHVDTSRFIQCKPKRSMIKVNAFVYMCIGCYIVCYCDVYTMKIEYNDTYGTSTQSVSFTPIHINGFIYFMESNTFRYLTYNHAHIYRTLFEI